jgi:hypothetical protein
MSSTDGAILDRELVLHRELLAIARLRHIALRQGRLSALHVLHAAEALRLAELRRLEALAEPHCGASRARAPQIASMIRRLGSVERTNRALLLRHVVSCRHLEAGLAVLTAAP